jgi:glucose dehydrogenase
MGRTISGSNAIQQSAQCPRTILLNAHKANSLIARSHGKIPWNTKRKGKVEVMLGMNFRDI